MADQVTVPFPVRWIAAVLLALPGPSRAWADIVGHLAWPSVVLFLVLRYRSFLGSFLATFANRFHTDNVKLGPFEIRANDPVLVLDSERPDRLAPDYNLRDANRIERMFEFIAEDEGFLRLHEWMERNVGDQAEFENFLTEPGYAKAREQAFEQIEGLAG